MWVTMAQLALQFTLDEPAVTTVIPGIRTLDQLNDNLCAAAQPKLTSDEMTAINKITPEGGCRKIWPA